MILTSKQRAYTSPPSRHSSTDLDTAQIQRPTRLPSGVTWSLCNGDVWSAPLEGRQGGQHARPYVSRWSKAIYCALASGHAALRCFAPCNGPLQKSLDGGQEDLCASLHARPLQPRRTAFADISIPHIGKWAKASRRDCDYSASSARWTV
jgi:hypothetical protein